MVKNLTVLFLPRPGLRSVTEEVTLGWWDIISSFISELCPIQQTGSNLNRGLNKCLIILHFLNSCVNDCSLIKKKCINMSSPLTFPNTKGTPWLLKFLVVSDRNRRMPAVLRNSEYFIYFHNVPLIWVYNPLHTLLPPTRPESSQFKWSKWLLSVLHFDCQWTRGRMEMRCSYMKQLNCAKPFPS